MLAKSDNVVFYGIENINEKLEEILKSLSLGKELFEVKLIMSEAITNAFIHGNKKDTSKPINVKWKLKNDSINISVRDCGKENIDIMSRLDANENNILMESGRGLFIILSYSDEVKFKDGCIVIKKILSR